MVATVRRAGGGWSIGDPWFYDAWGAATQTAGPNPQYCANLGHKYDAESGLTYMRARYYEPSTGRFLSEDPAMDGLNWYLYCGNDPVNANDPTGMLRVTGSQSYFDIAMGTGLVLLFTAFILASPTLGVPPSASQRSVAVALLMTAAYFFGDALSETSASNTRMLKVLGAAGAVSGALMVIADALGKGKAKGVFASVAVIAAAAYSLMAIGLLMRLDYDEGP